MPERIVFTSETESIGLRRDLFERLMSHWGVDLASFKVGDDISSGRCPELAALLIDKDLHTIYKHDALGNWTFQVVSDPTQRKGIQEVGPFSILWIAGFLQLAKCCVRVSYSH